MREDEKLWQYWQAEKGGDSWSPEYPRLDRVYKKINSLLKGGTILEIGFGDGYLLKKLSGKFKCYGADISQKNVEKLSTELCDVRFDYINGEKLPYEDNKFDCFIASEVIEHMNNKELSDCIKEMGRVMKSGSYAVITVPAEENLSESECFCPKCGEVFHRWGHKQYWERKIIKEKFINFKIKEISEFFIPYRGKSRSESFLGYIVYMARIIINIFISLPNRVYLIILQKK